MDGHADDPFECKTHCTCAAITMTIWFSFMIHTLFLTIYTTLSWNQVVTRRSRSDCRCYCCWSMRNRWFYCIATVFILQSHKTNKILLFFSFLFILSGIEAWAFFYALFLWLNLHSVKKRNQNWWFIEEEYWCRYCY